MRARSDESGMAMVTVILAMSVLLALAVAAINYGLGSQNVSKRDQDSQAALNAAEAGLDNYAFHMNENAGYTGYSATSPPPDGNKAFQQYVSIPGGNTKGQYRYTADTSRFGTDGTITLTATGKVGNMKRTVQSVVRRRSFLDYLYFTDYETQDPASYTGSPYTSTQAQTYCALHYYESRNSNCNDIQFITADTINGPLHSNDAILMCGSPNFNGAVSSSWDTTGTRYRSGCGGTSPDFANPGDPRYVPALAMPPSNAALKGYTAAGQGGCLYTGPTRIVLKSNGQTFTPGVTNGGNYLDERVAWHVVMFPQPFGFQAEYTIGRGPELNAARTDVVLGKVSGGYMQVFYRYQCDTYCQSVYPFLRVQEYFGGRKAELNAPRNSVREWEVGLEYQFNRALELTVMYTWTQRNTPDATFTPAGSPPGACAVAGSGFGPCLQTPYQLQSGNLLRFQLQWSF